MKRSGGKAARETADLQQDSTFLVLSRSLEVPLVEGSTWAP